MRILGVPSQETFHIHCCESLRSSTVFMAIWSNTNPWEGSHCLIKLAVAII